MTIAKSPAKSTGVQKPEHIPELPSVVAHCASDKSGHWLQPQEKVGVHMMNLAQALTARRGTTEGATCTQ